LGVSATIDAACATQTERFASSVEALAASAFQASTLAKPQLHIIAEGIGAITTIATQWMLDNRRRPRAQLIDAT
jgi:hypothetical protein